MSQGDIGTALGSGFSGGRVPERTPQASGIVVLASNREVLYVNKTGRELLLRMNRREKGSASDGILPKALVALVEECVPLPQNGVGDRSWRRLTAARLAGAPGQSLYVQAFSQPRDRHRPRPVIVLTMQSSDPPVQPIE